MAMLKDQHGMEFIRDMLMYTDLGCKLLQSDQACILTINLFRRCFNEDRF